MLLETKGFLSSHFDMKDLGEASNVLGIEIHRDRRKGILGLSQKSYIEKVLKKINMHKVTTHLLQYSRALSLRIFNVPETNMRLMK
jgi:hypothetical protein